LRAPAVTVRNLRLTIEFDGAAYAGWQYQPEHATVQGTLEAAINRVTGETITVYGCGRTDARVSARRYVANFHSETKLPPGKLRLAVNWHLPEDISIVAIEEAPVGFNARHSARAKTYVYRIVRGVSPLRRRFTWEFHYPLDADRIRLAAELLVGVHDYRPFCQTRDEDGVCTVLGIGVTEFGDEVTVAVRGDRFLYKMVRRIVGALVAYGAGRVTKADIRAALAGRKHQPFQTAPAQGLLLDSVEY
jgi:tRNA pseudouridine38-40 synthase